MVYGEHVGRVASPGECAKETGHYRVSKASARSARLSNRRAKTNLYQPCRGMSRRRRRGRRSNGTLRPPVTHWYRTNDHKKIPATAALKAVISLAGAAAKAQLKIRCRTITSHWHPEFSRAGSALRRDNRVSRTVSSNCAPHRRRTDACPCRWHRNAAGTARLHLR